MLSLKILNRVLSKAFTHRPSGELIMPIGENADVQIFSNAKPDEKLLKPALTADCWVHKREPIDLQFISAKTD